jgi:hypothetical protein
MADNCKVFGFSYSYPQFQDSISTGSRSFAQHERSPGSHANQEEGRIYRIGTDGFARAMSRIVQQLRRRAETPAHHQGHWKSLRLPQL